MIRARHQVMAAGPERTVRQAARLTCRAIVVSGLLSLTACGNSGPDHSTSPTVATRPTSGGNTVPDAVTPIPAGPTLLYADAPAAPQLENVAPWQAAPILVSGASAYRKGEFLYQDFLYDDHGAGANTAYPSDAVYAGNAADLVEFRIKPLADATAIRVTLNSLIDPERVAFTTALGGSALPLAWPHAAGVMSPAAYFLTVHGSHAELLNAATGLPLSPAPTVTVDMTRRQFDVRVPHAAWNPGGSSISVTSGVGLWDATNNAYLAPTSNSTTPSVPGSGSKATAAIYNVAFRYAEPLSAAWRDSAQGTALTSGDLSSFTTMVDFAKLATGTSDESNVPSTGTIDRIYSSNFEPTQGVDPTRTCGRYPAKGCDGVYAGRLQPYALYIPKRMVPLQGWGMTLLLHELGANYNAYGPQQWPQVLGERGSGSLVLTPEGRGPDGDYTDLPEADVFEAWADVKRHYPLDAGWVASAGYSMGGGGTLKLLSRWPDLFGRGMSLAAVPQAAQYLRPENYRNNPLMVWIGNYDEGTPPYLSLPARSAMTSAGLQYVWYQFLSEDHFLIEANDSWTGVPEFLGEARAKADVPHISFQDVACFDSPRAGVANHAWWLSKLAVRDTSTTANGTVDAQSFGFGFSDPIPSGEATSAGVLMGGTQGPQSYQSTIQDLSSPGIVAPEDKLVIKVTNLSSMAISMERAKLTCGAQVTLATDGPVDVGFEGCGLVLHFDGTPSAGTTLTLPSTRVVPDVCDPTGTLPSGINCISALPVPVVKPSTPSCIAP